MTVELSRAQEQAVGRLLSDDPSHTGGYAGTGKTTLLHYVAEADPSTLFLAPTNKAVRVLASKLPEGSQISTLHKATQVAMIDDDGKLLGFRERDEQLQPGQRVVVDEASMVGSKTMATAAYALSRACVHMVGDPFQLPPVNDDPVFHYGTLDNELTEVFRQAEDSPILELATRLRDKRRWNPELPHQFGFDILRGRDVVKDMELLNRLVTGEAVNLTFTNASRVTFNTRTRLAISAAVGTGFDSSLRMPVHTQERVMFYESRAGLYMNGDTGTVLAVEPDELNPHQFHCLVRLDHPANDFEDTIEVTFDLRVMHANNPANEKYNLDLDEEIAAAAFGYSSTVHKSQGSQYDTVLMHMNDPFEKVAEFYYTGITRAVNNLMFVEG